MFTILKIDDASSLLYAQVIEVRRWTPHIERDPAATEALCMYCLHEKPVSDFYWSNRRQRWSKMCRECVNNPEIATMGHEDGKDFFRPIPVLQRALDHTKKLLSEAVHECHVWGERGKAEPELRHWCERYILLDERCKLISEKMDEVLFMQAAFEDCKVKP